jgi:histone acetyltransferase HTATIP
MSGHAHTKKVKIDEGKPGPGNLKAGTRVLAKWRDGEEKEAVVVERRLLVPAQLPAPSSTDNVIVMPLRPVEAYNYYVHWTDWNRRMDSWITAACIRFDAEGEAAAAAEEAARKRDKERSDAAAAGGGGEGGEGGKGKSAPSGGGGGGGGVAHRKRTAGAGVPAEAGGGRAALVEEDELGNVFRGRKRRADGTLIIDYVDPEHPAHMGEEALRIHEDFTKVKNVNTLQLGVHRMDTWYFSALPAEYWEEKGYMDVLYVCEFCLKFFRHESELKHHCTKCRLRHPPGNEIYRGMDGIGMWELDGSKEKLYCQNLAYISKMFLDHKNLWYDVDAL